MSTQIRKPARQLTQKQRQRMRAVLYSDIPGLREQFRAFSDAEAVKPRLSTLSMMRVLARGIANELLNLYTVLSTPMVTNRYCKYNGHVVTAASFRCTYCGAHVDPNQQQIRLANSAGRRRMTSADAANYWVDEKTVANRLEDSNKTTFRSAW